MDPDSLIGIIIISFGIIFLTYVVWWSRRTIETISKKKLRSIREILNEINNGQ